MRFLKNLLITIVGLVVVLALVVFVTLRPNLPITTVALTPPAAVGNLNVLIFGATRNTGLEVTKILTVRGDKVTAFVRPTSNTEQLEALGVELAVGDAMQPETILKAFAENDFDAVVTTIGNIRANPPPDFEGNANIFDAAVKSGVDRVIMISSIGAGDSNDAPPWLSKLVLTKVLPLKTQAENHLKAADLAYTIIRPGGLPPDTATGGGVLTEEKDAFGFIARGDLARLIVGVLDDDNTIGKTFAALDPARSSPFDRDN
jgi:uncharacterized protein YbjT (DUF2867 family)